jgi:glycosyltransferase involved in cell wall biosynthesis
MNDAEALCTARLLSALVQAGARVHLVSWDGPATLAPDIVQEVLDPRIPVTRVAYGEHGSRVAGIFRYGTPDHLTKWIAPAVAATNAVLKRYEAPILMTRAMPIVSNMVGYYCRQNARAWVAHFSDPYPPFEWQSHWYSRFARPLNKRWARRILQTADLVTVTCPNAIRYIEEKTGMTFQQKALVVTHLALPQLRPGNFKLDRSPDEFIVAHIGNLMTLRRPDLLLRGVLMAMERHPQIRFLQYGNVDPEILSLCRSTAAFQRLDIRHIANLSPRDATDLRRQVDVNVTIDTDLGLPYSPFILLKFPHCVCSGRPMLLISSSDSAMAVYAKTQDSGAVFVPYGSPESIADAIAGLYVNRQQWQGPSQAAMEQFGPLQIVGELKTRLQALTSTAESGN